MDGWVVFSCKFFSGMLLQLFKRNAQLSEDVMLFLSSVYMSLVIFKVDQQERQKQNRWCLYLFACFPSLSLSLSISLSLNFLIQEGWPTWDKQKEEDCHPLIFL